MATTQKNKISTNLWFDNQAEEAAKYYVSIFPDSQIGRVTRYGKEGYEIHKRPAGSVMTVEFWLQGHEFVGLNGGLFSNSLKQYPWSLIAIPRKKLTGIGKSFQREVIKRHNSVAGYKTSMAFHGRLFPGLCRIC